MATVKVKNAAGEWVDAIAAEAYERKAANFKMVWVERSADGLSYDLSPYLLENDDFMLAFTYGTGANAAPGYLWLGSEGKARVIDGDNILLNVNHSGSPLDMISDIESTTDSTTSNFTYDKVSRTFTLINPGTTGRKVGTHAALIYAG